MLFWRRRFRMKSHHSRRDRRPVSNPKKCQPPKKECNSYRRADNHVHIFRHEIHSELHAAIFCMVSADKFLFRFGEIEGETIGLCKCGGGKG